LATSDAGIHDWEWISTTPFRPVRTHSVLIPSYSHAKVLLAFPHDAFVAHFFQAINKFESMVNQIKKNAEDIEQRLDMIRKTTLFKPCPPNQLGELPSCKVMLMPRSLCC